MASRVVPTEVLKAMREAARMSQATVAKAMGTVPSVISKLENAEDAEPELAGRYLQAVGTELAMGALDFYARDWRHGEPPSYLHPDREALWNVDKTLSRVESFETSDKNRPILRGPIALLRAELNMAALYLRRRDHTIAWVGDIGVGKTTALAHAVGLLVGDGRGPRKPAFPVGSGRTTLCETAVKVAPTFGVSVDALQDVEVIKLVKELVQALAPGGSGGVAAEVNRALRNMAGMRIRREPAGEGEFRMVDPLVDMMAQGLTPDQAADRMVAAMKLPERKERQLILPEGSVDGLIWLSVLVSKINNGTEERFGIARRITVLMPSANLAADGQVLSVVDTRGIEGTTQRADLTAHRDDPRTLMVLCTKFADAPGLSALRFLEEARASGSDAVERRRACVLVLPRGDEALHLPGLDEPLSRRSEGYAVRKQEVGGAFTKAGVEKPAVFFFDAHADDAAGFWRQLRGQIGEMRASFSQRVTAAADGVANLIENVDIVKTSEARRRLEVDADRIIALVDRIPASLRPAHLNLLEQMEAVHPSSLAASIVRGGEWENFQMDHILGVGVRMDANLRITDHLSRMEHKLQEFEVEHRELLDVVSSIEVIRQGIAQGRQDFLASALTIGQEAFGTLLSGRADVFEKAKERYGVGRGYKRDVAVYWREYFETGRHAPTLMAIDGRLQQSWEQNVISPLKSRTRAGSD